MQPNVMLCRSSASTQRDRHRLWVRSVVWSGTLRCAVCGCVARPRASAVWNRAEGVAWAVVFPNTCYTCHTCSVCTGACWRLRCGVAWLGWPGVLTWIGVWRHAWAMANPSTGVPEDFVVVIPFAVWWSSTAAMITAAVQRPGATADSVRKELAPVYALEAAALYGRSGAQSGPGSAS
jgi:hypothetical protein